MAPKSRATGYLGSKFVGIPAATGQRPAAPAPAVPTLYNPATNPGGPVLPPRGYQGYNPWEQAGGQLPGQVGGGAGPTFLPAMPAPQVMTDDFGGLGPGAYLPGGLPMPTKQPGYAPGGYPGQPPPAHLMPGMGGMGAQAGAMNGVGAQVFPRGPMGGPNLRHDGIKGNYAASLMGGPMTLGNMYQMTQKKKVPQF